jgi:ornithine carbamoyltransferase
MKDLLRTQDLSRDEVELLLETAAAFAEDPLRSKSALANLSVAIYRTKP